MLWAFITLGKPRSPSFGRDQPPRGVRRIDPEMIETQMFDQSPSADIVCCMSPKQYIDVQSPALRQHAIDHGCERLYTNAGMLRFW